MDSPVSVTVNQNIVAMEYAVRGAIPQRAAELAGQGRKTILCNIGNPQAFGQQPISYYREVLSFLEMPAKLSRERALKRLFKQNPAAFGGLEESSLASDYLLDLCDSVLSKQPAGLGAYTESSGPRWIREAIAEFIDTRDGVTDSVGTRADPDAIVISNGASECAKYIIDTLISAPHDGIMVPIPQYPLYSAAIKKAGGVQVNYYPDEDSGWTLDRSILEEALAKAQREGVTVKALVVINPGNPTGSILPEQSVREVVEFAQEHRVAIIADEVYQDNLYGAEFVSFAKSVGRQPVALFSLHSTSKGFCGECGRRGGYVEVRNPPQIKGSDTKFVDLLVKLASVSLCSNTVGQVLTYLMVKPPPKGSAPHEQYVREKEGVLRSLHDKALMIRKAFDEMEGVECFGTTGAMYLFPRLNRLPAGIGDFDYCMSLLDSTGLCTVNGSGFGQRSGTHHLRIAFLPSREQLEQVLPEWVAFHNRYVGRR